jgi:hypothetical protein
VGLTGGSFYTLVCDQEDEALGGFTGYNPATGYLTNHTSSILSVLADVQIDAAAGNWDVDFRKYNGATDTSVWRSKAANYEIGSYSHSVLLRPLEYMYVQYAISGPTGYNVSSPNTHIQFTRLR